MEGTSSLCAEVSRVPGRKETLRVPPSETVTYQRPDHRLWPSTRTLIVLGPWKWPGEIWLDQKTPKGPVDCPAGSWSCWDTFHFNSSKCQWNQGAVFQKEKEKNGLRPSTRDQVLPFNVVVWQVFAVMAGLRSAVKGSDDTVKAKPISFFLLQNRRDPFCLVAFSFYSLSYLNKEKWISTEAVQLMVQSILRKNKTIFYTCRKYAYFSLCSKWNTGLSSVLTSNSAGAVKTPEPWTDSF